MKKLTWLTLVGCLTSSAFALPVQDVKVNVDVVSGEKRVYWDGVRVLATNEATADYLAALKPYSGQYQCKVKGESTVYWGEHYVRIAVVHAMSNCLPIPN